MLSLYADTNDPALRKQIEKMRNETPRQREKRLAKVVPEAEHFSGTFSMTLPVDLDREKLDEDIKKAQAKREKEKAEAKAAHDEISSTLETDRKAMLEKIKESAEEDS